MAGAFGSARHRESRPWTHLGLNRRLEHRARSDWRGADTRAPPGEISSYQSVDRTRGAREAVRASTLLPGIENRGKASRRTRRSLHNRSSLRLIVADLH